MKANSILTHICSLLTASDLGSYSFVVGEIGGTKIGGVWNGYQHGTGIASISPPWSSLLPDWPASRGQKQGGADWWIIIDAGGMLRVTRRWRSRRAVADERKSPHRVNFWHVFDSTFFFNRFLNRRFFPYFERHLRVARENTVLILRPAKTIPQTIPLQEIWCRRRSEKGSTH